MFRFAAAPLLAFAFAMIPGSRATDAGAISVDLDVSQFCAGCSSLLDDTVKTDPDGHPGTEPASIWKALQDILACKYHDRLDCRNIDDSYTFDVATEIVKFTNLDIESQIVHSKISLEYLDNHQANNGCSYFESKVRDPRRVAAECDSVEPGSDHPELLNVLTLVTVSVVAFALLAGIWLLHRFIRSWRLRKMMLRDKPDSGVQLRNSSRRGSGAARALR
jgi:hypothetical protein